MKNFAVLASGYGGNLQAIIDALKKRKIRANLTVVISDKAQAFALVRARKAGIASVYVNPGDFSDRQAFDQKVVEYLKAYKVDFVVLAGYMRLLSPYFIKQYPNGIINIHPAILPSFKGIHGIRDAFDYGVKITGVSVHFVSEAMDEGAIIAQEIVKITAKDTLKTLEEKIHKVEHKLYPKVVNDLALGRLKLSGRKVVLRTRVSRP